MYFVLIHKYFFLFFFLFCFLFFSSATVAHCDVASSHLVKKKKGCKIDQSHAAAEKRLLSSVLSESFFLSFFLSFLRSFVLSLICFFFPSFSNFLSFFLPSFLHKCLRLGSPPRGVPPLFPFSPPLPLFRAKQLSGPGGFTAEFNLCGVKK
ncbi:hypothetical protein GGS21DRAFT_397657 [Xylaria nigripes]|nr:hypothetical protein GGS21DRAFT_397657 [Xylaria nigripes]